MRIATPFIYSFVVVSFLLFWACSKDKLAEPTPNACAPIPTYDGELKALIDANCATAGCHDVIQSSPGNFTEYSTMASYLSSGEMADRVLVKGDMPLGDQLTAEEIAVFRCWFNNGAPEN